MGRRKEGGFIKNSDRDWMCDERDVGMGKIRMRNSMIIIINLKYPMMEDYDIIKLYIVYI